MASRAVIKEPLYCLPSTMMTPIGMPAMMRFRIGEILRSRIT
jgi:hypothetical protein